MPSMSSEKTAMSPDHPPVTEWMISLMLEAGRLEERARNGVERRNGVAATVDPWTVDKGNRRDQPGCRWRSAWAQRAIRIADEAPTGSSWMCCGPTYAFVCCDNKAHKISRPLPLERAAIHSRWPHDQISHNEAPADPTIGRPRPRRSLFTTTPILLMHTNGTLELS